VGKNYQLIGGPIGSSGPRFGGKNSLKSTAFSPRCIFKISDLEEVQYDLEENQGSTLLNQGFIDTRWLFGISEPSTGTSYLRLTTPKESENFRSVPFSSFWKTNRGVPILGVELQGVLKTTTSTFNSPVPIVLNPTSSGFKK